MPPAVDSVLKMKKYSRTLVVKYTRSSITLRACLMSEAPRDYKGSTHLYPYVCDYHIYFLDVLPHPAVGLSTRGHMGGRVTPPTHTTVRLSFLHSWSHAFRARGYI